MPHRTTRGPAAGSRAGPWLVSMAMWANFLRFLGQDGRPLRKMQERLSGRRLVSGVGESPVMGRWLVTPLQADDRPAWSALFRGYLDFYQVPASEQRLAVVWEWLHSPDHELSGIVVRRCAGAEPAGLAHYRPFPRPLHGTVGCYLDDLFVEPGSRGTGAVDALLARLREIAAAHDWDTVRWITRSGNARARSAYDRLAQRTDLVTYDMPPGPQPRAGY